ncbi:MAG: DNA repair protein RadC [Bacteroidales bacterium]|nr:DNA repair protein RadC [Bacteroidales bacterium]
MEDKKSIKNWSEGDQPREKLLKKGNDSLSDAELIAILIGSGSVDKSAVELAREILDSCNNNLNLLGKKSVLELIKHKGIGEAKAISIVAAMELGKRRKLEKAMEQKKITSSNIAFEYFQPLMCDLTHEEFHIMFLNRANIIIDSIRLSTGGTTGTVMDVKLIIKQALDRLAQGLIIAHNHPSGNKQPSKADFDITKKIKEAAAIMDISLLDHIIIAGNNYYSFADEGAI